MVPVCPPFMKKQATYAAFEMIALIPSVYFSEQSVSEGFEGLSPKNIP